MPALPISAFTILLAAAVVSAYRLPDATSRVPVFSDQLNDAPNSANLAFNAAHFVGMQKIDKARIEAYKKINPDFIVLQYHKSFGVDLQGNITSATPPYWNNDCDTFCSWVARHPSYGSRESYYQHYTTAVDSAHRIEHYFSGVNEYYLADLRHAGWRQYVAEVNVWRCLNIGFDGTFFDATYFPSYGYKPETWFDYEPYNAGGITSFGATWNQTFALPYWGFVRRYFHSEGRDILCIVNCDQMVTGWYNDDYLDSTDGAMAEGFFTYGGKLTGGDWTLSAGRIIRYLTGAGKNKVLIAQCSPAAGNLSLRRWCIGNYFLVKNKYSYYNIASDSYANWWPEYEIELDSFLTQPATLSDLLVPGAASLYKRDFKAGLVLVNPGAATQSFTLTQRYQPVAFSGGGAVTNGTLPAMSVTYGATVTGAVSVAPGEVLILRREGVNGVMKQTPAPMPGRKSGEFFTIDGRRIGTGSPGPGKSGTVSNRKCPGVYIFRPAAGGGERCRTVLLK